MAKAKGLETGLILLMVFGKLTCAEHARVPSSAACPPQSVTESIFGMGDSICPLNGIESFDFGGVIEVISQLYLHVNLLVCAVHMFKIMFKGLLCSFSILFMQNSKNCWFRIFMLFDQLWMVGGKD